MKMLEVVSASFSAVAPVHEVESTSIRGTPNCHPAAHAVRQHRISIPLFYSERDSAALYEVRAFPMPRPWLLISEQLNGHLMSDLPTTLHIAAMVYCTLEA